MDRCGYVSPLSCVYGMGVGHHHTRKHTFSSIIAIVYRRPEEMQAMSAKADFRTTLCMSKLTGLLDQPVHDRRPGYGLLDSADQARA